MHKGREMHLKAQATPLGHHGWLQDSEGDCCSTLHWGAPHGHADGQPVGGVFAELLNAPPELSTQPRVHFEMTPGARQDLTRDCWHLSPLSWQDQLGPGTAHPAEHEVVSDRGCLGLAMCLAAWSQPQWPGGHGSSY